MSSVTIESQVAGGNNELSMLAAQDTHLTYKPTMTFFKSKMVRHTNFARVQFEQAINNAMSAASSQQRTTLLERTADLLCGLYWRQVLPGIMFRRVNGQHTNSGVGTAGRGYYTAAFAAAHPAPTDSGFSAASPLLGVSAQHGFMYVDGYGHFALENATCRIGGTEVETCSSEYRHMWHNVASKHDHFCSETLGLAPPNGGIGDLVKRALYDQEIIAPIPFHFTLHMGKALPLIALQQHDVNIVTKFRAAKSLFGGVGDGAAIGGLPGFDVTQMGNDLAASQISLVHELIMLDSAERAFFAMNPHDYLIDQVQEFHEQSATTVSQYNGANLSVNHPVREIIFAVRRAGRTADGDEGSTQTKVAGENLVTQSSARWDVNRYSDFSGGRICDPVSQPHDSILSATLSLDSGKRFVLPAAFLREINATKHHSRTPYGFVYSYVFDEGNVETEYPKGTCNFSANDNTKFSMLFNQDEASKMASGGPIEHPARNIFIAFRNINVCKIAAGMYGLLYAA